MTNTGRPREWDAATYDALPLPHEQWGHRLLATLDLRGDERVVDVGAGTGRDTAALLERLPDGQVVAIDGSTTMLDRLRDRLGAVGADRLTVLLADLREPLTLSEPVDAVFSVATLHWLPDHEAVFRSLAAVLRPGGVLRAEWGGTGNLASINAALVDLGLASVNDALQFAGAEQTAARLGAAGFVDVQVELVRTRLGSSPATSSRRFCTPSSSGLCSTRCPRNGALRSSATLRHACQRPEVDYVRLQAAARLPVVPSAS